MSNRNNADARHERRINSIIRFNKQSITAARRAARCVPDSERAEEHLTDAAQYARKASEVKQ